jgi:predicted transposase YdaD
MTRKPFSTSFREETMYESSIARHFAERGRREGVEQGRKEGRMLSVIDVISARFGSNNAEALKPTLESIEDTALLPRILIKACQVENYSKQ